MARIKYDPEAKAAYIYLEEVRVGGVVKSKSLDDKDLDEKCGKQVILDFDDNFKIVGIEILDVDKVEDYNGNKL